MLRGVGIRPVRSLFIQMANKTMNSDLLLKYLDNEASDQEMREVLDWLEAVNVMDLPEFRACITAYRNWFQEILNSMDVPWSNGFIEGCNNKTKVLKRVCFGMRNFRNFRNRILFCSGVPKKPRRG